MRHKALQLAATPQDDPAFVEAVETILDVVVSENSPEVVAVIQIENRFDHKWLRFSGKVLGALGVWKSPLTIPPFHPNRVVRETAHRRVERGEYEQFRAPPLHVVQPSDRNLNRRLRQRTDSGVFLWWSGDSVTSGKGSVMVYVHVGEVPACWFASLDRDTTWRINKTKGITRGIVERYLEPGGAHAD